MECKHGLLKGTCASCRRPGRGYQTYRLTGDQPVLCSLCRQRIEWDDQAVWYLRKPSHRRCVTDLGEPDGMQDREDRWAELRSEQ